MSTASAPPGRRFFSVRGYLVSLIAQLLLVVLGVLFWVGDDLTWSNSILALWCTTATIYTIVTIAAMGRMARRVDAVPDDRPSAFQLGRVSRFTSIASTIFASLVGFGAATQLLGFRNDPELGSLVDVLGVWAMLLAWGLLHWGFAQVYLQLYFSSPTPPLVFPGTTTPNMIDFAYFSYTVGTSFAASDVTVVLSRVRWRIVWHSVLSFFFNGLIIVLALNTIMESVG